MSRRYLAMIVVAAAAVLGLAACGGGGNGGGGSSSARDSSTIKIESSALGDILVDGSGHALYLYTPDGANATSSKCDAGCQQAWPPVKGKPKAGAGVDASLIGTTTGSSAQAIYAGHPLYYYAQDNSAGDVNGQGVGSIWYVLDSKGASVTKAAPSGGTGGGGY